MADQLSIEPSERAVSPGTGPVTAPAGSGRYLSQFDSYRVIACGAVVLQHSLLWTVTAGNVTPWAFVMLLHFSRTAFFFLTALVLTYAQITRPRSTADFWRRRYVQLGVPYLMWTAIYWGFTLLTVAGSWGHAGSLLWHELVFGYYQLYFVVVLLQLYLVFPLLLRALESTSHHVLVMAVSGAFALVLAADLHYTQWFGPLGDATRWLGSIWPWARDPLTYQEQFVAGILVALHFDQVRRFVERWYRPVIGGALVIGLVATLWYLVAVWTGSTTGRASISTSPSPFSGSLRRWRASSAPPGGGGTGELLPPPLRTGPGSGPCRQPTSRASRGASSSAMCCSSTWCARRSAPPGSAPTSGGRERSRSPLR